ncbi:hypothetical protein HK405_003261 [Cladochytrium tenue]|nr:hypothetical protein HK405_003261 [Cladochytrium tenue]
MPANSVLAAAASAGVALVGAISVFSADASAAPQPATYACTPAASTTASSLTSSLVHYTLPAATSTASSSAPSATHTFESWSTFKANGVNLGSWLEIELSLTPQIFDIPVTLGLTDSVPADEWTFSEILAASSPKLLESVMVDRYANFITKAHIDKLALYGVDTLRIPTTYAAWVKVSGSALYHGNQSVYLADICDYAVEKYGMHIVIGHHSLPGGVNSLNIGEAYGHGDWFFNETNWNYSLEAVNATLKFIAERSYPEAYGFSPFNEAANNLTGFATEFGLSDDARAYLVEYAKTVLAYAKELAPETTVVFQDCFIGATYWEQFFDAATDNLIFDTHIYFFEASGTYAKYANWTVCGTAEVMSAKNFPTVVGEWSLHVKYNNTLAGRQALFQTQVYAWKKYLAGGLFWTAVFTDNTTTVSGEGTKADYWSYMNLIDAGVVNVGGTINSSIGCVW